MALPDVAPVALSGSRRVKVLLKPNVPLVVNSSFL